MRVILIALLGAVALALALPTVAGADSVTTDGFPTVVIPGQATVSFSSISIDARSGPNGENPSGRVSYDSDFGNASGPVTCLSVNGPLAVIGFSNGDGTSKTVAVVDRGRGGPLDEPDEFAFNFAARPPTDCSSSGLVDPYPIRSGDFTVDDPEVDTPPTLAVPRHAIVDATGAAGAVVSYAATAGDDEDSAPTVSCSPRSGSVFPVGVTTVTCTATDSGGNTADRRFPVVVRTPDQQVVAVSGVTFALRITPFGPPVIAVLDLVAVSGPGGAGLTATATLANSPAFFFIKRVTCLAVSGTKATIGVVTGSPFVPNQEFNDVIAVNDNGAPGIGRDALFLDLGASSGCPPPSALSGTIDSGEVTVVPARAAVRGMVGKGSVSGGGKTAAYAYRVPCAAVVGSGPPFEVRFGAQRFRLTSVRSVSCSNDPAVATPAAGFDTQSGSGTGTLTSGGPGRVDWKFVDGGAGGAKDSVQLTIRNASNAIVFQGSAAPPAAFPGSDQPTGANTAQAL